MTCLNSCGSLIERKGISEYEEAEKQEIGKKFIIEKIINNEQKPIISVVIKLVINNKSCINAHSNFHRNFSFFLDISKINKDHYFEIIYKGYRKKIISFSEFTTEIIKLENGENNKI